MPARDLVEKFRLYLITDDRGRSIDDLVSIVARALSGGVTAVQFREKCAAPAYCAAAFEQLSQLCADAGVPLLLNSDLLNMFTPVREPDGIHFNERTLPLHAHELAVIAGYSAHNVEELLNARDHGIDFCTFSPIYDTPSKAGLLPALGVESLNTARQSIGGMPIVALGGIDETNAQTCIQNGATGIAVMRGIMSAGDPGEAAAILRRAVDSAN